MELAGELFETWKLENGAGCVVASSGSVGGSTTMEVGSVSMYPVAAKISGRTRVPSDN